MSKSLFVVLIDNRRKVSMGIVSFVTLRFINKQIRFVTILVYFIDRSIHFARKNTLKSQNELNVYVYAVSGKRTRWYFENFNPMAIRYEYEKLI